MRHGRGRNRGSARGKTVPVLAAMAATALVFDGTRVTSVGVPQARTALGHAPLVWFDADARTPEIDDLLSFLQLHPLTIEDVFETRSTPKVEDFGRYLYIRAHGVTVPRRRRGEPQSRRAGHRRRSRLGVHPPSAGDGRGHGGAGGSPALGARRRSGARRAPAAGPADGSGAARDGRRRRRARQAGESFARPRSPAYGRAPGAARCAAPCTASAGPPCTSARCCCASPAASSRPSPPSSCRSSGTSTITRCGWPTWWTTRATSSPASSRPTSPWSPTASTR